MSHRLRSNPACLCLALLLPALAGAAGDEGALERNTSGATRRLQDYGRLPLRFEANQGQTDSRVKFLARGGGHGLFLTPTEAVLSLRPAVADAGPRTARTAVVRMKVAGGHLSPSMEGLDLLPGRSAYLIGVDRRKWRHGIPSYGSVSYRDVYPGVDLVYHGRQGALEYDFIVAPGADPRRIAVEFDGADELEIDGSGALVVHTAAGPLVQRPPVVYQDTHGRRRTVAGSYQLRGGRRVGFNVGPYDASVPLVIDPVLEYASYLGGSSEDQAIGIAVDSGGSAFVAGFTASLDFPAAGPLQPTNAGGDADAFVLKLDPSGSSVVYATYLGGSGSDGIRSVAVDTAGAAYLVGPTASADFPTVGAFQPALSGSYDVFAAKLSADGSSLVYSSYLGGSAEDSANGVALDAAGNAYVTGYTTSLDFPTMNPFQPTFGGAFDDAFVAKVSADGSALVYSSYLGGSDRDHGLGLAVDTAGNAYVTGGTLSANFPTSNALQPTFHGVRDAFATKVGATGILAYSTYIGGAADDLTQGIAVDAGGNAYLAGMTFSPDFPTTPGALQSALAGERDAFVVKLAPAGTALVYATYLGGSSVDLARGIAVGPAGAADVVGLTFSPNFPVADELDSTLGGGSDAFVARLSPSGSSLSFSTYLGGAGEEWGMAVATDSAGGVYVGGRTSSADFPATPGAAQPAFAGGTFDAFVAKIFEAAVSADLRIVKSAVPSVAVFDDLDYHLTVTNLGPDAASGVIVTDALPDHVDFVSASSSQGSCAGTSTVVCSLGTIASGEGANVAIRAEPTQTGLAANTAQVTGQEADPDPAQNTAVAKVKVTLPPLYPGPDGPEDVNAFLQYARPLRPTTWVPFAHGYEVRIHYGKTILPSTFTATLDGAPVAGFVPVPNRFQKVTIPLHRGVNVLRLRVSGVRPFGMWATDVDTLTFVVP
jgi:uncharacterized repeat protein (TIGR01451 family)